MAPKKGAMKRPSAACANSAKKAKRAELEVVEKWDSIAIALKSYEAAPSDVRAVLSYAVKHSLSVCASDRHEFQREYVTQIGSLLEDIRKSMEEEKAKCQKIVDSAESEKTALAEAEKNTAETFEVLKAKQAKALATSSADSQVVQSIKEDIAFAIKLQSEVDDICIVVENKKQTLLEDYASMFLKMNENAADATTEVGQTLASVGAALTAEPENLGPFSRMVLPPFFDVVKKQVIGMNRELQSLEHAKQLRQAKVMAKQAEKTVAEEKAKASKEALERASSALIEGEKDLAAKRKAVTNFIPELKKAADSFDSCTLAYSKFMSGPMQAFFELKDLVPPPPPTEPEPA